VHNFIKTLTGMAAAAALGAVLMAGTPQQASAQSQAAQPAVQPGQTAAQPEKKTKDEGEYNIYNDVVKDLDPSSPNYQKAITDLNTWTQKYPETDFKNERFFYYLSAYAGLTPPQNEKVLEYGAQLLAGDLKANFKDQAQILNILYRTALAAQGIATAGQALTPAQLATAEKAGKTLQEFIPTYFTAANKPAAASDAQWAQARTQLDTVAKSTLDMVALAPGAQAMNRKDYPAAEQAFKKSLDAKPDNALVAYQLGTAILSQKDPNRYPEALYYIARAAGQDPAKGGLDAATRPKVDEYLKKLYTNVHGSDEGLDQLKQLAATSPHPPAGFKIKTSSEVAAEKEEQFKQQYPQLALWMGIKRQLTAPEGEQYFQGQLKDAQVPKLKGTVMGGKPECRSREVLVAVPEPNQTSTLTPEITLKLDAALTGKPVAGTEIQWEGVPSAFAKDPFLLTMDTEKAKIEGMKTETCTAAPAKKAPAGKKATPKKK
jgi:tetratricopeptide (TPR) repeat protein